MALAQRLLRISVGRSDPPGPEGQYLPLMIAGDGNPVARHERVGGFPRPQRSGKNVAKIHKAVARTSLGVRDHRLERRKIAVDIRKGRDAHWRRLSSNGAGSARVGTGLPMILRPATAANSRASRQY